ncbi:MAG: glycosyltransferase family 2 protein [Candidatus Omnitrophica bacterium]|nr:glycosyltransferase family 2 protein [Candidatus Omnitrophota bacterium]
MNAPFISLIICSYNRAQQLRRLLESVSHLRNLDAIDHEIIIVDNNSSDNTREVIEGFKPFLTIRSYLEKQQGLSYAKNRGIKEAKGAYLAFIDDDVCVDQNWLIELLRCIKEHTPDCIAVKVLPRWESERPAWLTDALSMNLGLLDYGDQPFHIRSRDRQFVGTSFCVKRSLFDNERYLFKTQLGRTGKRVLSSEETELFLRLLRDHRLIWYWPSAFVYHIVPRHRMSVGYLLKWNFYYGQSMGKLQTFFPLGLYESKKAMLLKRTKLIMRNLITLHKRYIELLTLCARFIGLIVYTLSKHNQADNAD